MFFSLRKLFFISSLNSILFLILLIGIQNSSVKHKINFLFYETIELPLSFIIGTSFISGSIAGSLTNYNFLFKK